MKNIFILTVLLAVLSVSCKNDDDPKPATCVLSKALLDSKTALDVEFNASNKPITINSYDNLGLLSSSQPLEYDSKGRINKLTYRDKAGVTQNYQEYLYNVDGLLAKANSYSKNGSGNFEISGVSTYEYDDKKRLVKSSHLNESEVLQTYRTYEYDTQNRIIKETAYDGSSSDLEETTDYEYDDKRSWAKGLGLPPILAAYISDNNITKQTIKDEFGVVSSYSTTTTYEYNAD